jgi:hypothetical protein
MKILSEVLSLLRADEWKDAVGLRGNIFATSCRTRARDCLIAVKLTDQGGKALEHIYHSRRK